MYWKTLILYWLVFPPSLLKVTVAPESFLESYFCTRGPTANRYFVHRNNTLDRILCVQSLVLEISFAPQILLWSYFCARKHTATLILCTNTHSEPWSCTPKLYFEKIVCPKTLLNQHFVPQKQRIRESKLTQVGRANLAKRTKNWFWHLWEHPWVHHCCIF